MDHPNTTPLCAVCNGTRMVMGDHPCPFCEEREIQMQEQTALRPMDPSFAPKYVAVWYDRANEPVAWACDLDTYAAWFKVDQKRKEWDAMHPDRPALYRITARLGTPALA